MSNNFPTIRPTLNLQFANTGILDPRITFTRASSSGGYYDGVTVVKAEENLFLQSQALDNAYWTKVNVTITTDAIAAPDGTATADLLLETTATGGHSFGKTGSFTSATYTVSFFAKYYSRQFVRVDTLGAGATIAYFDIQNGVLGSATAGITHTITSVGSGWYRCTATFTGVAACFIGLAESDGVVSYTGIVTEGAYIWGAQLEQRSTVTAYTPTTTAPITNYIPKMLFAPANVPVFDHNPTTGEALGLSVWEARTNLLLRSQEFDNASWVKAAATVSVNQVIAPDGTLTGCKFMPGTTNASHSLFQSISASASTAYTRGFFLKAAEFTWAYVRQYDGINNRGAWFDLVNGVTGNVEAGVTATIKSVGNGWYFCAATYTSGSGATVERCQLNISTTNNGSVATPSDGYSGIYVWGAQLESNAFSTPYIPTVASTVTRSADVAVMTGENFSRWYRADEGTFVANYKSNVTTSIAGVVYANDGTGINQISLRVQTGNRTLISVRGVTVASLVAGGYVQGTEYKLAASHKADDFAASLDGAAVVTDTAGAVPVVTQMRIGDLGTGFTLSGYIKSIQYYPARLTNDNLVAVTA